jgi:O-acetylserine/cysteine efflux transporter
MKTQHLVFLLGINFFWAASFLVGKIGMETFPPLLFTVLRYLVIIICLLPIIKIPRGHWKKIFQVGFLMGIMHYSLMWWGLNEADEIAPVAIMAQMFAPCGTILAVIILKEQVGWRRWSAIGMAFLGVMIIGFDPKVFDNIFALSLVFLAAASMGLYQVVVRTIEGVDALNILLWVAIIGTGPMIIFSLLMESNQFLIMQNASMVDWGTVLFQGIGVSVIGHGGVNFLLKRYPVSMVSPYLLMAPVLAIFSGVIFWTDVLTVELVIGGGMVISGVAILTLRNRVKIEQAA